VRYYYSALSYITTTRISSIKGRQLKKIKEYLKDIKLFTWMMNLIWKTIVFISVTGSGVIATLLSKHHRY